MKLLELAKEHRVNSRGKPHPSSTRIVSSPLPSTGTNYNLVGSVEHDRNDRVIWHIIHSPEGSFTYDYSIKSPRRRRKRCPESGCQNFVEPGHRKCINCRLKTRKDRNRRHYQVLKTRFKTDSS